MPIHDMRCKRCETVEFDVVVPSDGKYTRCECGGERTWVPSRVNTDITGGPFYSTSLDMNFGSKSDLKAHLKANGLSEAGDPVGGARNTSHLGLGKTFSYNGQASRTTQAERGGRRSRAAN